MRILEFICPRCREKIRAEIPDQEIAEDPIRLFCSDQDAAGCGWMGYLPLARGVPVE